MNDAVPGLVPRMLVDPDIGLFRADERVFTAMLDLVLVFGQQTEEFTKLAPVAIISEALGHSPATIERHAVDSAAAYAQYITARRTLTDNVPKRSAKSPTPTSQITVHASFPWGTTSKGDTNHPETKSRNSGSSKAR